MRPPLIEIYLQTPSVSPHRKPWRKLNLRFKTHNINVKCIHTIYSFFVLEQDCGVSEWVPGALAGDWCSRRPLHSNRRHRKYKSAQRVYHHSAKSNHKPMDGWASSFFPPQSLSLCHTQFQYFLGAGLTIQQKARETEWLNKLHWTRELILDFCYYCVTRSILILISWKETLGGSEAPSHMGGHAPVAVMNCELQNFRSVTLNYLLQINSPLG